MKDQEKYLVLLLLMVTILIIAVSPLRATTTSGSSSWADITHPQDLNGFPLVDQAPCIDRESGQQGMCYIVQGPDAIYLAFHDQNGAPVFLRRLRPEGGYDTIWHRDTNAPVPSGIPL
jgi:hypothetical protein